MSYFYVCWEKEVLSTQVTPISGLLLCGETRVLTDDSIFRYSLQRNARFHKNRVSSNIDGFILAAAEITPKCFAIKSNKCFYCRRTPHFCLNIFSFHGKGHKNLFALKNNENLFSLSKEFVQVAISHFFVRWVIHLSHHGNMAQNPGERCLYKFLCQIFI